MPQTITSGGKLSMFDLEGDMGRRRGQRPSRKNPRKVNGSWQVRWREDVRAVDGGIKRVEFAKVLAPCRGPGKLTKREADRLAQEAIFARLDTASINPASMATLDEFVILKYEQGVLYQHEKSGRRWKLGHLRNHLLPALGHRRMRDITPEDVSKLVRAKLDAGLSVQTVRHIVNVLANVFRYAKELGYFTGELPAAFVRLPKMRRKERGALSFAQVAELMSELPKLADLILFLAVTGVRIGEATGLRWKRLNLSDELVSVDGVVIGPQSVEIRDNWVLGEYTTPKTAASVRQIPLPRALCERLVARRAAATFHGDEHPVFAGKTGRPIDTGNALMRDLKPALRRIGLPAASWHWLRHSATSFADQAGLSAVERQKGLGHASAGMTMHYSHAEADRVRAGLERIADRLLGKTGGGVVEISGRTGTED